MERKEKIGIKIKIKTHINIINKQITTKAGKKHQVQEQ
jgi:hypothetical protein